MNLQTVQQSMLKVAIMSAEEKKLRRMARPFYPESGRRSWEHVNQVKRNAEMMTQGLEHRPLTLQEKAAIYFHDCAIRERGTGKQHGYYGREKALPLLLSTGFFTDKQLDEIGQAILEHDTLNATGKKFTNHVGEVLASGDANPPDLPWLLNKFYTWQLTNNPDKETWPADIYETAVEEFGNKSTEKFPAYYNKFHGDRIQKLRDKIDSMSQDEMWDVVQRYRKKHHLAEMDNRLGAPPEFRPVLEKAAAQDPKEWQISGAILGCLGTDSNEVDYEVDEELPDDPWGAIIHSKGPVTAAELQTWHNLHNVDVDKKGVPYYFLVSHVPTGKRFVWYSDDDAMMPLDTEEEHKQAVDAGKNKGLIPDQLDF